MFCAECRLLIPQGDSCHQCGKVPNALQPPPVKFDKKGDLEEHLLNRRYGKPDELEPFLASERAKVIEARSKLAGPPPLGEQDIGVGSAIDFWEQALDAAERWSSSQAETDYQAALAMASQTDEQLKRAVIADWNRSMEVWMAEQETLRAQSSMGNFQLGNWPK